MNKKQSISNEEFNKRVTWTLDQKIDHSLYVIDAFLVKFPNSKIAFSGGIDSTVMLKLVRIFNAKRTAVFANTTNEFSDIIRFVKEIDDVEIVNPKISFKDTVKQFGFPLISKKVAVMINRVKHPTGKDDNTVRLYLTGIKSDGTKSKGSWTIPKKYLYLLDVPFNITHECCEHLKKAPMKELSEDGIFIGTMAVDSNTRKEAYLKTSCISIEEKACMPLSIWTKEDVNLFLKKFNVKYASIYDKGETSTGCAYCGFGCQFDKTRFERRKILEPNRYEIMMELKNNGVKYIDAIDLVLKRLNNSRKS